jgi:DNA-binding transcriptional MerR regulator
MQTYSTATVARKVGVVKSTLLRWLYAGKIPEPRRLHNGGVDARIWSQKDLKRVREYKQAHYRKGRGRKKKAADKGVSSTLSRPERSRAIGTQRA